MGCPGGETVIVLGIFGAVVVLAMAVELLRWVLRPEARRLRVIRKIGGRQCCRKPRNRTW
jgi:hypothetical protein